MIVVSDTSPLILLAKLDMLHILASLFGSVLAPEAVMREVGHRAEELARVEASGVVVRRMISNSTAVQAFSVFLGSGESEAIVLARETKSGLILMDDMRARKAAESFGIKVAGTLAIVVMAWEKQLIEDGPAVVQHLREEGLWLADSLYQRAIEEMSRPEPDHTLRR